MVEMKRLFKRTKRKIQKQEKTVTEPKNVYAQRSWYSFARIQTPTEAEWEYAAAADVGQREYNI
jgi:formylglycine-generating enzyme required for sulfatase activity